MRTFTEPTKDNLASLFAVDEEFLHDGTLAVFQAGGESWRHWNRAMRQVVLSTQIKSGKLTGSWDPRGKGSRVRATALRVATLTVYYRYARLFKR
jgi:hypothetical protein